MFSREDSFFYALPTRVLMELSSMNNFDKSFCDKHCCRVLANLAEWLTKRCHSKESSLYNPVKKTLSLGRDQLSGKGYNLKNPCTGSLDNTEYQVL